jgi:hypothetical protein
VISETSFFGIVFEGNPRGDDACKKKPTLDWLTGALALLAHAHDNAGAINRTT